MRENCDKGSFAFKWFKWFKLNGSGFKWVVLEKFNRIDYGISNWSTLSFFLQACQEGAKTFREEQCLRKQSGSVPYFVSSCMCVTLTVFHLYIMCNSRPYVYEASSKVRWPKIITRNFHLELQLGSWQRVFNYCI